MAQERRALKLRVRGSLREQHLRTSDGLRAWTRRWLDWLNRQALLSEQSCWIVMRLLSRLEWADKEIQATEQRLRNLTRADPVVARLLAMKGIGLITACTLRAEVGRFDRFHLGKQLARFDERWSALAHRLLKAGKKRSLVIAAVANRWVRWLWHEMQQVPPAEG